MRTHPHLKKLLLMLVIGALLIAPMIASAQEEGEPAGEEDTSAEVQAEEAEHSDAAEESSEEEAPEGIGLLFLLMGLGGIVLVGGAMIGRDMFTPDTPTEATSTT